MRDWLVELLVDPASHAPLVAGGQWIDGELVEGWLGSGDRRYAVRNGIPRFMDGDGESQTAASFGYKWTRRDAASARFRAWYEAWLIRKYGFGDRAGVKQYFAGRRRVLEVGCGSGLSSTLTRAGLGDGTRWVGLDLTPAVDVAQRRLGPHPDASLVQADVMTPPFREGSFDTVFTEGVLHHTPSTERALAAAVSLLESGGEILFYVYARKAPIRELTDEYVRSVVSQLPPEEAWERLRPITSLARALAELNVAVDVPEDVELLGIRAGRHDVHELIYWHFAKLFWNPEMGVDGSELVNFDWYHPTYAHRHTVEEVEAWCARLDLTITYCHSEESGHTVRATKG